MRLFINFNIKDILYNSPGVRRAYRHLKRKWKGDKRAKFSNFEIKSPDNMKLMKFYYNINFKYKKWHWGLNILQEELWVEFPTQLDFYWTKIIDAEFINKALLYSFYALSVFLRR